MIATSNFRSCLCRRHARGSFSGIQLFPFSSSAYADLRKRVRDSRTHTPQHTPRATTKSGRTYARPLTRNHDERNAVDQVSMTMMFARSRRVKRRADTHLRYLPTFYLLILKSSRSYIHFHLKHRIQMTSHFEREKSVKRVQLDIGTDFSMQENGGRERERDDTRVRVQGEPSVTARFSIGERDRRLGEESTRNQRVLFAYPPRTI